MKVLKDLKKRSRTDPVGAETRYRIRVYAFKKKGRRSAEVSVDQEHQILILKIQYMLDLKLKIGQKGEIKARKKGVYRRQELKLCNELRAKGIITPAWVAVTQDQNLWCMRCAHSPRWAFPKTSPSRPMISTSSGIFPSAWVAQERHGS